MKKVLSGILVSALIAAFLGPWQAFADGSAVEGTDPTGGSCDGGWWDTCNGYSWQTYKVTQSLPNNGVTLHTTANTGDIVYITKCPVGSVIYNYGLEVYNPNYLGYQVSTQRAKYGRQASHASAARGAYPGSLATIQNYTTPNGYVTMAEAKDAFDRLNVYISTHPDEIGDYSGVGVSWDNVGAFCFNPSKMDVDDTPSFQSQSNAAAKRTGNGEEQYISTGIVSSTTEKTTKEALKITTGESVELRFSHNLYADNSVSESKNWNVSRRFGVPLGGSSGQPSGTTTFTTKNPGSDLYVADNRTYMDKDSNRYVFRDTYNYTFSTAGKYTFCESITLDSLTTTACVVVEVEDPPVNSFLSQSHAAAKEKSSGEEKYITTGTVSSSTEKTAETLEVAVGKKVELRFSHNLYASNSVSESKNWNVSRNFAVPLNGGSEPPSGSTTFTTKDTGLNLYAADARAYSDGTYQYVFRDTYEYTFTTKGNYKFCESITIDSLTTTACVVVNVGNVPSQEEDKPQTLCVTTPSSYTSSGSQSGTTSVSSVVRNNSLTNNYSVYQNSVYAKPYDTVEWCHDYFPGVQAASGANVTHENQDPEPTEGLWYSNTLDNHTFADYSNWANYFNISSHNVNKPSYSYSSGTYSAGDTTIRETGNTDQIETGQAGQTLWETITSSFPSSASADSGESHSWGCHWRCDSDICGEHCCASHCEPNTCDEGVTSCGCTTVCDAYCCNSCYVDTCYHDNDYYSNSRSGTASDTSYVYVPYNFSNWAFVSISNSLVYAGETMTIGSSTVTVETKYNNVTQDTYATQVDDAKAKLVGYLSTYNAGSAIVDHGSSDICSALSGRIKNGSCDELNSYNGMTFNPTANYDGTPKDKPESLGFAGQTYNVYDSTAGDYYCVVVAIYPYTSGSDTNLSSSGSDTWYISAPSCRVIAKRPTFQVWGGSVFSEKNIETSSAAKNNIRSIFSYTPAGSRNTTVYGSWAEQSVVANGLVSGLASGAASGLLAKAPWGGSKEGSGVDFCNYRVPLSIANFASGSETICRSSQKTGEAGISGAAIDPDALMDYWWVMNAGYIDKSNLNLSVDYVEAKTIRGNQVRYTESKDSESITIGAALIPKGITHIVKSTGDITIKGDIKYEDPGYTTEMDIPKLLIYAGGNITIDCTVGRIDAIIISEKQVKTCNSNDDNAMANSRRLIINGVVIAGSAVFNRTYGAATSINSREPAEIINYDTSAIIWGRDMADANDFETLTTVYQHELAPRY